jgi:nitroreductase
MEAWLYGRVTDAELRAQIGEFIDLALVQLTSEETSGMLVFNESPLERLRGLD